MGTRCVISTEHVRKLFLSAHNSEFDANCQTCHVGRFKFEVGTRSGWNWRKLGANINRYSGHQEEASGQCNALNAIFFLAHRVIAIYLEDTCGRGSGVIFWLKRYLA